MTTHHPLRLAVGSHKAGSGKGCAMNIVSWENGDSTITDLPPCSDPMLARVVQGVNDTHCTHRDGDLLCPPCSLDVLALAHRTAGTNLAALGWGGDAVRRVWVRLAVEEAVSVEHLCPDARVRECNATVLRWLDGKATDGEVRVARQAAWAAASAAAAGAAYHAVRAAVATADAIADDDGHAAFAIAWAVHADATARRIDRAHALIDRFEQHTGIRATPVAEETVLAAVGQMLAAR